MTLGEKIKHSRLSKKLTQKELAGNKITRNMLSRIESDKANPSLDTLKYLSKELSLPLSYFFSEDADLFFYEKKKLINEIYLALESKSYKACINLINRLSDRDDELNFILTTSHFEIGKSSLLRGALISAKNNLKLAREYAKATVLDTQHIETLIPMYYAIAENIQAPLLEFDITSYLKGLYNTFDYEFFKYLTLDFDYPYTTPAFKKHIEAKALIKERDYSGAVKLLLEVAEINNKDAYNAFAIFAIYSDLESCYKQLYDFENAYRYSTKRLSLIEAFKA